MRKQSDQPSKSVKPSLLQVVSAVVLLVVLAVLFLPATLPDPQFRRTECRNMLKQIGIALHNYYDKYHCFPPAYIADKNGKPMHSWRVLLLPFFGAPAFETTYKRYRFDEPWDGPHNRELAADPVGSILYRCPAERKGPETDTSYVVVVGPATVFPGAKCVRIREITDGTQNTIAVVEMVNSRINWREPRDLTFDQALRGINPESQVGISSHHERGVNILFADGHVEFLMNETPQSLLRLLLERNDGKPTPGFRAGEP